MNKQFYLSSLFYLLSITCLQAASVNSLYDATVPLEAGQVANNKVVLQQGMSQVLVKVTGNKQVVDYKIIKNAIENPENYLLKYSQKVNQKSEYITETDEVITTKELVSIQNYSSARINSLLQNASLPVWGKQRPLTLAWIMIEREPNQRLLLNDSEDSNFNNLYKEIVNTQATARGLPLVYPLQDLQEQVSTSGASIWAQSPDDLIKASDRYNADIIFSASLYAKADHTWFAKWLVIHNGKATTFETTAPYLTATIQEGINWLADNLAKVYTSNLSAPAESINIRINNITSLDKYAAVDRYLASLSVIDKYALNHLSDNHLELQVSVKNGRKALLAALKLDNKLVELDANDKAVVQYDSFSNSDHETASNSKQMGSENILEFRWRS
jgi:hypothetical protein